MARIVQKFGGTSVATIERIQAVAKRVAYTVANGHQVAVVVSAMGHETDRLVDLAVELIGDPSLKPSRELDMLLATGEQVSIALVAMALQQAGCPAVSMLGAQAGVLTTEHPSQARIVKIDTERLERHLERGEVVVMAGFQGMTGTANDWEITTLGRGGSDTSAVALAVALQADCCEIYTDVEGVLTTDPRIVPTARLLSEITSAEMLELASLGAQVMHPRAMEIARNYGIPVKVLSSWSPLPTQGSLNPLGTLITSPQVDTYRSSGGLELVQAVNAVVLDRDQVKIVLLHVPDRPGIAAHVFEIIAQAGINVDLVLQSISTPEPGQCVADIAFTIPHAYADQATQTASQILADLGGKELLIDDQVAKISIAGVGMMGRPGIAADMFRVLADQGINLHMISTSEIKVSCVVAAAQASDAALILGEFFRVIPHTHRAVPVPIVSGQPVRGIALDAKQARLGILHIPDRPGMAATIFGRLATAGVIVDTIVQSQRGTHNSQGIPTTAIAFTTTRDHSATAHQMLLDIAQELGDPDIDVILDTAIAKVSIVGAEMEAHPGVAARMFRALANATINIEMIATSEIKVSCIINVNQGSFALQAIHQSFMEATS